MYQNGRRKSSPKYSSFPFHHTQVSDLTLNHWGVICFTSSEPHSLMHQRQGLCGVNAGPNYFTIILQSSVGTLEGHSESVCIGRNRCATYTNHVITIRNHICKSAGCGAKGPTLVVYFCVVVSTQNIFRNAADFSHLKRIAENQFLRPKLHLTTTATVAVVGWR